MMRVDSFVRSALFGALAALGSLPWLIALGPLVGLQRGLGLYLTIVAATYVAGLVPRGARRFGAAVAVAGLGCGIVLLAHTLSEVALGLAVLLGAVRSAVLYRARTARAVATEVILVTAGLLFARFLAGTSLPSVMLAIWGFFLVQSVFFLIGGASPRAAAGRHPDPFEEAHGRALALLGGNGV
jgi:hypothetical protein